MKYTSHLKQLSLDTFCSSFDDLDKNNRWVKLGDLLPWTELEKVYNSCVDEAQSAAGNKLACIIIGVCIIKHKFSRSDKETVSMIQKNPYIQYLHCLSNFTDKSLFDQSLFTTIRKRIAIEEINRFTTELFNKGLASKEACQIEKQKCKDDNEELPITCTGDNGVGFMDSQKRTHKGVLKINATCDDAEVRYPVAVDIIHNGYKIADRYIRKIYKWLHIKNIRSFYCDACSFYIELIKRKKKETILIRSTTSAMLNHMKKVLRKLVELFVEFRSSQDILQPHEQCILRTTFGMCSQQSEMFEEKKHQCKDRILCIFQPHVPSIVRSKSETPTEFGEKAGVVANEEYTFIEHYSGNTCNENSKFLLQIQSFKERFGHVPATILADKIYISKAYKTILKEYEIKAYCKPLDRLTKKIKSSEYIEKIGEVVEERNEVECSFGLGKRIYRASNIRAKFPETLGCWTGMCYFVKSMMKVLRGLRLAIFEFWLNLWIDTIANIGLQL